MIIVRDADGEIEAFENRCAHCGALIALEKSGKVDRFQGIYHAWRDNHQGDLTGIAFEKGVKGQGGMPPDFYKEAHGPHKRRIAVFGGQVFGSFLEDVPNIGDSLGDDICQRMERVRHKPVEVIGRFTQALPNNWQLYVENAKDSDHASLLHRFFTTLELNRLSQKGGVIVDESGGHHVSYTDDTPAQRKVRHKQSNLVGPAGLISMEDGAVGGFVHRRCQRP